MLRNDNQAIAVIDVDAAMERYADGDDAAFADIYDALAPRLLRFLRRRTDKSVGLAEDLLQDTFENICDGRGSFIRGAKVTPWAFSIARRLVIDTYRKTARQTANMHNEYVASTTRPTYQVPIAYEVTLARELAERVEIELARMPDAQREAFTLVKVDGLSMAEAAEVLEISPNAVKLRACRAYDVLRASIGDMLDKEWLP